METERIALSQRERDRWKVLHEVQQKHLTQVEAAVRLKVTDRQVRRMLLRLRERGDHSLVHGLRGRPSNRKLAARFEQKILARLRQRYADFGPTLAAEHLAQEGLSVSRETLRKWMTQAALWRPRAQRPGRSRFPNNCGEIRCAHSLGERCTNWGSNGSRPTVRKRKGVSRGCLKRCRIAW